MKKFGIEVKNVIASMTEEIRVIFDDGEASGESGDFAYPIIADGPVREVDGKLRIEIKDTPLIPKFH